MRTPLVRRAFIRTLTRTAIAALGLWGRALRAEESDWLLVPIERRPVESSNLASVGYHRAARVLEVEFRSGSLYRYREIPLEVYEALLKAESKGRYFSNSIRGKYPFHRVKDSAQ